jgi:hypothetical protein
MTRKIGTPTDYPAKAKARVREHVDQRLSAYLVDTSELPPYEVYLTDFSFILGGWKARVGTTMDDRMYYEVTYNFERGETYLTAFRRLENVTIPDKE